MKKIILWAVGMLIGMTSFGQTYTFTPAGAAGQTGPTQAQVNTAYTGTSLDGNVDVNAGIQYWVVPATASYTIEATGASGGGVSGGSGAHMEGMFSLNAGDTLLIVVGQQGVDGMDGSASGGGGSYVVLRDPSSTTVTSQGRPVTPLIIAGGGGANPGTAHPDCNANTTTGGNDGDGVDGSGVGGTNGNGGGISVPNGNNRGGGGGGFLTDGERTGTCTSNGEESGWSFLNGSEGGLSTSCGTGQYPGGFGGGGGAISTGWRSSGGGGGYSGGGGGQTNSIATTHRGGGGGSFNSGLNQNNSLSIQAGDGVVVISTLSSGSANDAGVVSVDSPSVFCPGSHNVVASIQNFGSNQLDSVMVNWSINGTVQTPIHYKSILDTIGGTNPVSTQITLGSFAFTTSPQYTIKVWTSQPNGTTDTTTTNDTLSVTVTPGLPAPTGLAVSNITANSVDVSWNVVAPNYVIIYGTSGFNPATGGATISSSTSPATISSLTNATLYDVYIVGDCGGSVYGDTAGPVSFTTLCGNLTTLTLPFYENFETASGTYVGDAVGVHCTPAVQWNFETSVQTDGRLSFDLGYSNTSIGANDTVGASMDEVANGTPINFLIGTLDLSNYDTSGTSFILLEFYHLDHGDEAQANDYVWVRGDVSDPWIQVYDLDANGVNGQWVLATGIDLSTILKTNGQNFSSNFQIRFGQEDNTNITSASGVDGRTFDDITIEEVACLEIQSATVSNILPTSATISVPNPNDSFNIELGFCGFSQGSGFPVMGSFQGTTTLTGLTPNTCYEFYVQRNCDTNGISGWFGPFTFTTQCNIFSAPFSENFDGPTWVAGSSSGANDTIDNCWSRNSETGYKWSVYDATTSSTNTGPDQDHTGVNFLYTESSSTSPSIAEIVTPLIDVSSLNTPFLSFYYHRYGSVTNMGDMDVDINDGSGWVTLLTLTGTEQTAGTDPFTEEGLDISAFGDTVQIRFSATAISCCAGDMAIDLVEVKEAPPCPAISGLDTVSVSDTSAILYWNASTKATQYQVWYGPQGFFQGSGTAGAVKVLSANDTLTISPLNAMFCYEYVVRSICAPGDSSAWAGPFIFCTKLNYDVELSSLIVPNGCGSANSEVAAVIRNNGDSSLANIPINVDLSGTHSNSFSTIYPGPLASGASDTVVMGTINTATGALITYEGYVNLGTDQVSSNDSLRLDSIFAIPLDPVAYDTTFCASKDTAVLQALPIPGVLYNWFANTTDTVPLFSGNPFKIPMGSVQPTYYVEYGDSEDSLNTLYAGGNGCGGGNMFDITAHTGLNITGFAVNSGVAASTALTVTVHYIANGTYSGNETTPAAWTLHEAVATVAAGPGNKTVAMFSNPISIPNGATYGIYVEFDADYTNGNGTNQTYTNGDMTINLGVGLCSSFGGLNDPRVFNGTVYYGGPGCSNTRLPVNVTIGSDTASAAFTTSGSGLSYTFNAASSVNGDSYAWDFGDGNTGTGVNPSHTYGSKGIYTVTLTVSDTTGCHSTDIADTTLTLNIGLAENALERSLVVFPNPASEEVNISFVSPDSKEVTIRILDLSGKEIIVLDPGGINGHYESAINLGQLADGVYMLEISSGNLKAHHRLVKQ